MHNVGIKLFAIEPSVLDLLLQLLADLVLPSVQLQHWSHQELVEVLFLLLVLLRCLLLAFKSCTSSLSSLVLKY